MRLTEREIHGVTPMAGNNSSPLIVRETDNEVIIQEGYSAKLTLSATSARFLARKLNRLALRIEKRAEASAIEARRAETQGGSVADESAAANGETSNHPSQSEGEYPVNGHSDVK